MVFKKEGRIPEEEEGQAGCEQGGKTSEQLSGQGGDEASHLNNIIAIIISIITTTMIIITTTIIMIMIIRGTPESPPQCPLIWWMR